MKALTNPILTNTTTGQRKSFEALKKQYEGSIKRYVTFNTEDYGYVHGLFVSDNRTNVCVAKWLNKDQK